MDNLKQKMSCSFSDHLQDWTDPTSKFSFYNPASIAKRGSLAWEWQIRIGIAGYNLRQVGHEPGYRESPMFRGLQKGTTFALPSARFHCQAIGELTSKYVTQLGLLHSSSEAFENLVIYAYVLAEPFSVALPSQRAPSPQKTRSLNVLLVLKLSYLVFIPLDSIAIQPSCGDWSWMRETFARHERKTPACGIESL